jgi:biopolymer transport protein ExbB
LVTSRPELVARFQRALTGCGCWLASVPAALAQESAQGMGAQGIPAIAAAHLPRDLSPWSMFLAADVVVKAVMIGLAIASLVTWTIWLAKTIEIRIARGKLERALDAIRDARSLAEAHQRLGSRRGVGMALLAAAEEELRLSFGIAEKSGKKERVALRLQRLEAATSRAMLRGTGVLATIGSTAPFVGLFGTVWGIMNSFIGISKAQTTNLAVVAPGIAEALLATALGLLAAIPAVIIYNHFSRSTAAYKALVGDTSAEVQRLVSRDLDRMSAGVELAVAAE